MQFRTLRGLASSSEGSSPQIKVETQTDETIRIRGNGKNGYRQVINGSFHFQDGLITDDGDDGPVGAQGNVLYFNSGKWVPLANPSGGGGISVLTHDGTNPAWTATSECE